MTVGVAVPVKLGRVFTVMTIDHEALASTESVTVKSAV
jgi:hypothetical protein